MAECQTMKCVKMVGKFPTSLELLTEEKVPAVPPEGALVKVLFAGMCHSDALIWEKAPVLPINLGHEIAGTIHSIGQSASNPDALAIGDNVAVYPWIGCQRCKPCLAWKALLCDLPSLQQVEIGITTDGGYAQFVAVPKVACLVKVPKTVPMEIAGMLGCGMLTAYNAVQTAITKIDPVLAMRDKCGILVIGAGGLGLSAINLLKALVLPKYDNVEVFCADLLENKLSVALEAGCHGIIHLKDGESEEERISRVKSAFHEGGPHIVIDFVGTNGTFNIAFQSLKKTGSILCVGLYGGTGVMPLYPLISKAINVHGIYTGNLQQMKDLVEVVATGKVKLVPFEIYNLEDAPKLIHKLRSGEIVGRAVLAPNQ
ncbi:alcohol dehydrogenase-like [Ptychodera flava]|uniref:alcohol dehydrogenase-like n=1 Tax=Ptychodera flava TaxID=63121 RepID=UPI003969F4F0